MASEPLVYPPLPDDLRRGVSWRSLKYFGAGAIVASVTIASGETLFGSRAGALFGYSMLWCFVAGAIMKGAQVYSGMRYMVLTGEHPMTHWAYLPGPRNWVPITIGVLSLLCFPFWQSGLPLMLGNIANWIVGIDSAEPRYWLWARGWATIAIAISVTLVLLESYAFLEKAQTLMVALLLGCLLAAVVAARPDWWAALVGIVTPRVPDYEAWAAAKYPKIVANSPWVEVMTYLGAVGGGTYDYVGYVGLLREKSWGGMGSKADKYTIAAARPTMPLAIDQSDENLSRGRRWLLPAQIDTGICFASVAVFTLCFALLGARILRPEQLVPGGTDLFNYQARFLTDLHPLLLYVYQLGIFMAFFGTIYGAYEIYSRTAFECLMPVSARLRKVSFERFRRAIVLYCAVFGLLFLWTLTLRVNPDDIVRPAALLGGVFTCGLWCLAMLWTDRRFLPASLQMPRPLWALVAVSGVVLTLLGAKGIWDYVAGFFAS
jgi:Mn2+/Fe2+ NRAMP family transporter